MAQNFEFDLPTVLDVLGSGAAGSWSIANYAPRILKGDLQPGFAAAHMLKDLKIVEKMLAESELELPGAELATRLYERLCNRRQPTGRGGDGKTEREIGNHALITAYPRWQQP